MNNHPSIHPESIEAPGTWLDRSTTTSPESPRSALRSHWLLDRLWPLERYDGLVTSQWDRRNWWVGKKWDGCEDVGYRALGPVSATDVLGEKLGKLLQVVRRHQTHLGKDKFWVVLVVTMIVSMWNEIESKLRTWPIWFLALNHSGSDAGLSSTCKCHKDDDVYNYQDDKDGDGWFEKS